MKPRSGAAFATAGTEQWPSSFCKWVATSVLDDLLSPASTAGVGDSQSSETETSDDEKQDTGGKIFRFSPVTELAKETGGRLGETEELSLRCLKRGYVTGFELLQLSEKLPDETRIRESALEIEGQRSFTTGAYVHQDNVGLSRNHRWTSELLARVLAASFPGKPFSSLARFRDLKQPAHRDSTNGPWENLLLACTTFEGGGLWVQADDGPIKRQILNKEMGGRVLEWKRGRITFGAHRWHSTEHWTGTRLGRLYDRKHGESRSRGPWPATESGLCLGPSAGEGSGTGNGCHLASSPWGRGASQGMPPLGKQAIS